MKTGAGKYTPEEIRRMIVGLDTKVKVEGGAEVPAINFDNGATAPPFDKVAEEIQRQMLMYGSIGRGTGQKSRHSSEIYTQGRDAILKFVGANNGDYTVVYTNCTTDGMNKLASALIQSPDDTILATRMEHHANDLPWRERAQVVYVEVDGDGRLKMDEFAACLKKHRGKIKLVSVTAASNVTGYVNDVHKIARIAHEHGARIIVDGAQIVAHRRFSMLGSAKEENIDFFLFSAHKMYSPFGGGAIVGLTDVLSKHIPIFYGGGMVDKVTDDEVVYSGLPDRYEPGSPNYPGVVGMLKAIEVLEDIGFEYIEAHEQRLLAHAFKGLKSIPYVILYADCESFSDRVGTLVFNLSQHTNSQVANYLASHSAIAVRHAKFCAHPYVNRLLGLVETLDTACVSHEGLVRVSFGVYNTEAEVDALVQAINDIPSAGEMLDMVATPSAFPNDRG